MPRVITSPSESRTGILNSPVIFFVCAVLLACIAKWFAHGHPWIAVWLGLGAIASIARALRLA